MRPMRTARTALLLGWRLHRAELVAVMIAALGLSIAALSIAAALDRITADCRAATVVVAPCGGLTEMGQIYDSATNTQMYLAMQGLAVLPFAAAVVLGVALVAREIEQGTALLAWPLARSRGRWLAGRILPVALIGALILLVPAMAGDVLIRSLYPGVDPGGNFEGYGIRGALLVVRFGAVLILAALVGAWIGRQLPALLVAAVLAAGLGIGVQQVRPYLFEAVEQPQSIRFIDRVGNSYVATRYRDADGRWMREEDAWELLATAGDRPGPDMPEEVFFAIPRERYPDVVLRESLVLVAVGGLLSGALVLVISRRRPG